jgi:pyruvate dehydrogenase E2 component (dihydrolipoamide acetyltransferase)
MAVEIRVPRLGWSMEEGTFVEWLKRDGEFVEAGQPLFAIEGDKAIQDVEAIGSGILRISPQAPENGEPVRVGMTLALLVTEGEPDPFSGGSAILEAAVGETEQAAPIVDLSTHDSQPRASAGQPRSATLRPRISPRALRVAEELGITWRDLLGSGRDGRIRERDVRAAAEGRSVAANQQRASVAASSSDNAARAALRRTIAARMTSGSQTTAPVTLTTTADATNLVNLREQFKAAATPAETTPGYLALISKLTARVLAEHPQLNQQWIEGRIETPNGIHIAVAVDTSAGLLAPVVRDVPTLGLREIAARLNDLTTRALSGQLGPADLTGGTFTITNLGAYGVDAFTPIINVPQCAILGLGTIEKRPAVVDDQIVPRDQMVLSLTFDHRIVDGAPAARFLATLRRGIENPGPWLVT